MVYIVYGFNNIFVFYIYDVGVFLRELIIVLNKLIAGIIVCVVLMTVMRQYFIIVVVVVILLIIIRFLADIYWWGRDNDKW